MNFASKFLKPNVPESRIKSKPINLTKKILPNRRDFAKDCFGGDLLNDSQIGSNQNITKIESKENERSRELMKKVADIFVAQVNDESRQISKNKEIMGISFYFNYYFSR